MTMNSFDRFKQRNKNRIAATDSGNTKFIINGYNSTTISSGTTQIEAAVVNQQEKEYAYIYTKLNDSLTIGSQWTAKTLHFLITDEIITIKNVQWHKYKAELCNVQIGNIWGRFVTPEKSNVALKEEAILVSLQKPLLILPTNTLQFGDKIVIKNRPWLVHEYDNISTPGITYYSLTATTIGKNDAAANPNKDTYIVAAETEPYEVVENYTKNNINYIAPNIDITLTTEDGYFKYNNPSIKIKVRTATTVVFNLPFGVDEVEVQTRKDGNVVTTTYHKV